MSESDINQEIKDAEETIAAITVKIAENERQAEILEKECTNLIKQWIKEPCKGEEEKQKRIKEMIRLNEKEKLIDETYETLRMDKEDHVRKLRDHYVTAIRLFHKEKDARIAAEKEGKKKPEGKKQPDSYTNLHNSSILSGTSQAGLDDVNYAALFRNWEIDETNVKDSKKGSKSRKSKDKQDREPITYDTYYGSFTYASAYGKEIGYKTFTKPGFETAYDVLSKGYEDMHSMLGHPNLLAPIGVLKSKKAIVVELVKNPHRSLQDILDDKQKLGFTKKLQIAKCIAQALAWLHERKAEYKHLRLKPSNILFTRDWKIRVADYGLPFFHKYVPAAKIEELLFSTKHAHYCAPEIFEKYDAGEQASDLWSFGMLLFTLLTESIPFADAQNFADVHKQVSALHLPELPINTPPALKSMITKCWEKDPAKRGTFSELLFNQHQKDQSIWDGILKEVELAGQNYAAEIWKDAGAGKELKEIDWLTLSSTLWKHLNVKVDQETADCVQVLLGLNTNLEKSERDKQMVQRVHFSSFTKIFGLTKTKDDGASFLKGVVEICKQHWFYGITERNKCEAILNLGQSDTKKNVFLVRNSQNSGYVFTLSYFTKDKIEHLLLPPELYKDKSFISYLNEEVKKRKLTPVPDGNLDRLKFSSLFKKVDLLESDIAANANDSSSAANTLMGSMSTTGRRTVVL